MIYDFTIDVRVEVRVRENIIERVPSIVNRKLSNCKSHYSTVTDFARFLGWSTSIPLHTAM